LAKYSYDTGTNTQSKIAKCNARSNVNVSVRYAINVYAISIS